MSDFNSAAQSQSQWQAWRERAIALAAVALPILVLFGPALGSDRLFAMRDAGHYYYPLFKWCADEWGAGRVPLWNPLENCGTAVHADPTASIWYPGKLIFTLPLEFSICFKLYVVGHVVLCAWTSYWLARRWGASRYGAALAAMSYSCGGSVVFQHCNVVYLVGAAWLPVAAGLVDDIFRQRRLWLAVWLGVVLALIVLGGDPQMAYHVLLVAAIYAVVLVARRYDAGERRQVCLQVVRGGLLCGLSAVIALGLAAVQILPTAEAARESDRALSSTPRSAYEAASFLYGKWRAGGISEDNLVAAREGLLGPPIRETHHATAYDFSIGPWRLAELVWPNVGGRMFPTHRRWFSLLPEESRIWSPTLYLGLVPLVLGLSVFGLRIVDDRTRWLSWLLLVFTLGSLGTFGLGWCFRHLGWLLGLNFGEYALGWPDFAVGDEVGGVYWLLVVVLPKYVLFRYPAKLLVVAALAISQLAAVGWDRALVEPPRRLLLALSLLGSLSGAGAAAAMLFSQGLTLGGRQSDPVFGPFDNAGAWTDVITALLQTAIVAFAARWLLSKASGGRQLPESSHVLTRFAPALALALCAAELTIANHWIVPTAPASIWRSPSPIAAAIIASEHSPRIYRAPNPIWWPREFDERSSVNRMEQIVRWERETLAGRYGLLSGSAVVNSQVGIRSGHHKMLLDLIEGPIQPNVQVALADLGVEYLLLPATSQPQYADRQPVAGLPPEASLWLSREGIMYEPHTNYRFEIDGRAFHRGAWISGMSWAVLLVAIAAWAWRRRKSGKSAQC